MYCKLMKKLIHLLADPFSPKLLNNKFLQTSPYKRVYTIVSNLFLCMLLSGLSCVQTGVNFFNILRAHFLFESMILAPKFHTKAVFLAPTFCS